MHLSNLKILHQKMKELNIFVDTFNHHFNNVYSSVLFVCDYESGFSLTFCKNGTGEKLKLPVKKGYDLQIQGQDFSLFWSYFKIKAGKGKFKMKDFFNHLNEQIPPEPTTTSYKKRIVIGKNLPIEDAELLHFSHFINWEKARAQNPSLKKGRTNKNLEKTKLLYPDIYREIKDKDISVVYQATPENNEKHFIDNELNSLDPNK